MHQVASWFLFDSEHAYFVVCAEAGIAPMAEAVNYTLGQWEELTVFTGDGAVPIDNNVSEREMKRVVLNRSS